MYDFFFFIFFYQIVSLAWLFPFLVAFRIYDIDDDGCMQILLLKTKNIFMPFNFFFF